MKVPILLPNIFNHPFTYETALNLKVGDYVVVPFGKSKITGVVWDDFEKKNNRNFKVKNVLKKLNVTPLKKTTIKFLNWFSEYNIIPKGMALKLVLLSSSAIEKFPNDVYKNFESNMEEFKSRFSFFKQSSDDFFIKNQQKFDVIYIDGWHEAPQVYRDINNAWCSLNINGILICDDYFYGDLYGEPKNVPAEAINKFLKEQKNTLKILCVNNNQIFLKKI